jgi:DNA-binding transcriptional LysR family regulator
MESRPQHLASDHRNALQLVASGLGWAIAPQCARHAGQKGLVFREIPGARIEFGIAHLKAGSGRHVKALVRLWSSAAS